MSTAKDIRASTLPSKGKSLPGNGEVAGLGGGIGSTRTNGH